MSGDNSWHEDLRHPAGSSPAQTMGGSAGTSSHPHGNSNYSSSYDVGSSSGVWESVQPPPNVNSKRRTPSKRPRSVSSASVTSSAKSEAQKDRVAMACLHCRSRKVRCDGGQPRCGLCSRLNRSCSYARVTEAENLVLRTRKRELKARRHNREASTASASSQPPPRATSEGQEPGWSSLPATLSGLPGPSPATSRPRASTGGSGMSAYKAGLPLLTTSALAGSPELTCRVPGHHIGCYCDRCLALRNTSGYSTSPGTNTGSCFSHGDSPSQVLASGTSYVGVPGWTSPPSGTVRLNTAVVNEPPAYTGPAGALASSSTAAWPSVGPECVGTPVLPVSPLSPSSTLSNRYGYETPQRERAYTTSTYSTSPVLGLHSTSAASASPTSAWVTHQAQPGGRTRSSSSHVVPTVLRVAPAPTLEAMYDQSRRTAPAVSPKPPQESFHDARAQHVPGSMPPPDHWSLYARTQREEPMRKETVQLVDATSHVSLERAAIESQFGSMAATAPQPLPRTFAPTPLYPPNTHTLWHGQSSSLSPHPPHEQLSNESNVREEVGPAGSNFFQPTTTTVAEPLQAWQLYNNTSASHEAQRYRSNSSYHADARFDSNSESPFQSQLPPHQQHHQQQ